MTFDAPVALFALLLLIPLVLAALGGYRKNLSFFAQFPASRKLPLRYCVSQAAMISFYACLVVALAGPRWGTSLIPQFSRGVDAVLTIDLSRSMLALDGSASTPRVSRLEKALETARTLAGASGGARLGVVLGKGSGHLAIPLTEDTEAVLTLLEGLSADSVTGRGTNLESLVDAALGAFQEAFPSQRRIILFSDGESLSGSLAQGAERALAEDVAIIAVGMGSETGGVVPGLDNPSGAGDPVTSFLDRGALEAAAEKTGGAYFSGADGDTPARLIERTQGGDRVSSSYRREPKRGAFIFILIALGALGIWKLAGKQRRGDEN